MKILHAFIYDSNEIYYVIILFVVIFFCNLEKGIVSRVTSICMDNKIVTNAVEQCS